MRWLIAAILVLLCSAVSAADSEASDVRLLFDVSGSMKHNDPNRLSGSALELMVTLLPSKARGGLWTFGSRVANPLPSAAIDPAWRQRALALKPALFDYQQYTDIERAIRETANATSTSGEGKRHLILLTDGMVDIAADGGNKQTRDKASRQRLLEELAPTLSGEDVVIHTIAFSPGVDFSLLEGLAQETGGLAAVAEDPESLLRAFLDVFDRIFPRDQVPLAAKRFPVDDLVDAFSALLFHDPDSPPPVLIGPDGKRYTAEDHPAAVRWQHQPRFDIIHVPAPVAGEWRIEGDVGPDSRVSVESSLALRAPQLPTTLYQGFETPIEAWLTQPQAASDGALAGLKLRAELRSIDGNVRQSVALTPHGEHYRGQLAPPQQTGNARLVVIAKNAALIRERRQAVNVLAPISAELDDATGEVNLHADHPRLNTTNTAIAATLQGQALEVTNQDTQDWRISLPPLSDDVALPLTLTATVKLDGVTRTIELPELTLNPDADTGLRGASLERPGNDVETLEEEEEEQAEPQFSLAAVGDRVGQWLDALPAQVKNLWGEAPASLQRLARDYRNDPLVWLLGLVLLFLLAALWRARRKAAHQPPRRRHRTRRVEPHV